MSLSTPKPKSRSGAHGFRRLRFFPFLSNTPVLGELPTPPSLAKRLCGKATERQVRPLSHGCVQPESARQAFRTCLLQGSPLPTPHDGRPAARAFRHQRLHLLPPHPFPPPDRSPAAWKKCSLAVTPPHEDDAFPESDSGVAATVRQRASPLSWLALSRKAGRFLLPARGAANRQQLLPVRGSASWLPMFFSNCSVPPVPSAAFRRHLAGLPNEGWQVAVEPFSPFPRTVRGQLPNASSRGAAPLSSGVARVQVPNVKTTLKSRPDWFAFQDQLGTSAERHRRVDAFAFKVRRLRSLCLPCRAVSNPSSREGTKNQDILFACAKASCGCFAGCARLGRQPVWLRLAAILLWKGASASTAPCFAAGKWLSPLFALEISRHPSERRVLDKTRRTNPDRKPRGLR